MRIIILVLLLFSLSFSQADAVFNILDAQNAADSKSGFGKKGSTPGEFGILGSLAGVYNKSREAVKTTYDEIQYWKGIIGTYAKMKEWYEEQKNGFKRIGRTFGALFTDPKKLFSKEGLEAFDDAFNQIGGLKSGAELIGGKEFGNLHINIAPEKLNNLFGSAEKLRKATEKFDERFSGAIMPKTEEIYNNFNAMLPSSNIDNDLIKGFLPKSAEIKVNLVKQLDNKIAQKKELKNKIGQTELAKISLDADIKKLEKAQKNLSQYAPEQNYNKIIENTNKIYAEGGVETMPEYKIMETIKAMAASATENSQIYMTWAANVADSLNKKVLEVDKMFTTDENGNSQMDNIMDLQLLAAMNELEMVNANNKRIMHELELLKAHHAILGIEIWNHNKTKTKNENIIANSLTMKTGLQKKLDAMKNK